MKRQSLALLVSASILLPSAALAQLSVCGVSPSEIQQFGGFGADVSTIGDAVQMQVQLTPGVSNYLQFEVTQPTDIRLEATDDSGVDPVMVLLDISGNEVASDDDGGGGRASRIEASLNPGSYCARVYNFSSNTGPTTVQLGRLEHTPITMGTSGGGGGGSDPCTASTPATALAFGALNGAIANGNTLSITRTGQLTYHRFTLDSPLTLTLNATNPDADPVLRVYDATGNLIAENDDFDGLNSQINIQGALSAGEYCIAISALSDGSLPIEFSIAEFNEQAFLSARYDSAEAAPAIGGNHPIDDVGVISSSFSGDVLVGGVARWVSFEIREPSLMLVQAFGNGGADPQLYLYSDRGEKLDYNDDSGSGLDSQIARELFPGRYLIAVLLYSYDEGESSKPVRLSVTRYVRAQ
ncbi:MAG: ABC transporter substrate-binding protein [Rhodobacteraceae bacterium]|nr:ABC transporter substrate-binding protein [Paracoccaceae bacterium]